MEKWVYKIGVRCTGAEGVVEVHRANGLLVAASHHLGVWGVWECNFPYPGVQLESQEEPLILDLPNQAHWQVSWQDRDGQCYVTSYEGTSVATGVQRPAIPSPSIQDRLQGSVILRQAGATTPTNFQPEYSTSPGTTAPSSVSYRVVTYGDIERAQ